MNRFELKTDSMNIERGLGYQLISWKQYIDSGFRAMQPDDKVPSPADDMHYRYMTMEHIRRVMDKSSLYMSERR